MHLLYGPLSGSAVNMRSSTSVMSIVFSNGVDISNGPKAQYSSGLGIILFLLNLSTTMTFQYAM